MRIPKEIVILLTFGGIVLTVFLFGATAQGESSGLVKVIQLTDSIGATLAPVSNNEQVVSSISCRPVDYVNRYYQGRVELYDAARAKQAQCVAGNLSATILNQKIADVQASVAVMDQRLASLANTRSYLGKFSAANLNGLSLAAIPAGADEAKLYPSAANISVMCVKDAVAGTTDAEVEIGTAANDTAQVFNDLPTIALQKIAEIRANNIKLKDALSKITLSKGTFLASFISSSAQETVDAQSNLMGSTIALAQKNQEIAAQYLIPITMDDLTKNYKSLYLNKYFVSTGLSWVGGKREIKNMEKLPSSILKVVGQYVPRAKLPKSLTHVLLTIENQSATGWFPEADIYNQMLLTISAHSAEYQRLKAAYQAELKKLQTQLDQLKVNNYNCQ